MNPTNDLPQVKLLADGMLGRLARWLRILGYDTVYARDADDDELLRLARAQDRVLLTADHGLAVRRGARIVLIEAQNLADQLRQARSALGPPPRGALSRCVACNGKLVRVDKSELAGRLPPYVLATHQEFHRCPDCGRVFWRGTHVERMQAMLNDSG